MLFSHDALHHSGFCLHERVRGVYLLGEEFARRKIFRSARSRAKHKLRSGATKNAVSVAGAIMADSHEDCISSYR